jgi:muconolactone delta-isomerase
MKDLVETTADLPEGTPAEAGRRWAAAAVRASELAATGHRLWRPVGEPRGIGVWRAGDETLLRAKASQPPSALVDDRCGHRGRVPPQQPGPGRRECRTTHEVHGSRRCAPGRGGEPAPTASRRSPGCGKALHSCLRTAPSRRTP